MKDIILKLKERKKFIEDEISSLNNEILTKKERLELLKKVKTVISKAIELSNESVIKFIEQTVTDGLYNVYNTDTLSFTIEKTNIGGKPGIVFKLNKNGHSRTLSCYGGGIRNIISTILRFVIASYSAPNFPFILDEVGSNISKEYQVKFGILLKIFSRKFNRQVILITHQVKITDFADKIIEVNFLNNSTTISYK